MIPESTIQRVTAAANVADVVGDFIELHRSGRELMGLCPFHDDRHLGSFKVSPAKNMWICFACNEWGDSVSFLMKYEHLSFSDAIRWLGSKYGIPVEGSERFTTRKCEPHTPPPPLPTLMLPTAMMEARLSTQNVLCQWLRGLPWKAEARDRLEDVLAMYPIGTSRWGHTLFWLVDENGGIRTGKMMLYKSDGHRDKTSPGNFNWVHNALFKTGKFDEDKWEVRTTFFGMHLLNRYPNAEVHIVESEKTALICAAYYGHPEKQLWMATGGMQNLTASRLAPIIQQRRVIALHPDRDAVDQWRERRNDIGYRKAYISTSFVNLLWREEDGPKADLADIIVRIMKEEERKRCSVRLQVMMKENPEVKRLVEKLDLEEQPDESGETV